jgi:hypothetical protein
MKRNRKHFLLAAVASIAMAASGAGLAGVKTVYLLPMSNGLDQYLASQLTSGSVLQVVTDPAKADAIFTDHLGESLEQRLTDLYGDRKPDSHAADDKDKDGKADKDDKADSPKAPARTGMQGQRGRGTIFLVERMSRDVIWSDYQQPKYPTPDSMRHVAGLIANKLARALKEK